MWLARRVNYKLDETTGGQTMHSHSLTATSLHLRAKIKIQRNTSSSDIP